MFKDTPRIEDFEEMRLCANEAPRFSADSNERWKPAIERPIAYVDLQDHLSIRDELVAARDRIRRLEAEVEILSLRLAEGESMRTELIRLRDRCKNDVPYTGAFR